MAEKSKINIQVEEGEAEIEVDPEFVSQRLEEHSLVRDLSDIPILNDAEVLKHLEVRYKENLIHCYCGPTLIVTNPYKAVPHEGSPELRNKIMNCLNTDKLKNAPPNIMTLSATAFNYMFKMD